MTSIRTNFRLGAEAVRGLFERDGDSIRGALTLDDHDPETIEATVVQLDAHRVRVTRGDRSIVATILRHRGTTYVSAEGATFAFEDEDEGGAAGASAQGLMCRRPVR